MSSLSIRKLDEETIARLRIRAARRGVSMEEEIRRILRRAARAPDRLGDLATQIFGHSNGVDLDLRREESHEPVSFDD